MLTEATPTPTKKDRETERERDRERERLGKRGLTRQTCQEGIPRTIADLLS